MDFRSFIQKTVHDKSRFLAEDEPTDNVTLGEVPGNPDSVYFNMVNPDSGLRYDIPMLSPVDPGYYFKYVYYMQMKEDSPETFNKIINWE